MKKVVIIGGKGTALNIAEQIIDAKQRFDAPIELIGISIDDPELGNEINGIPILCKINELKSKFDQEDVFFLFALYRPDVLKERANLLMNLNISRNKFINFVHPSVAINSSAILGVGNVILSNSTIFSNVIIGNFNIINSNSVVEHDSTLGDYNFISSSSCIGSKVKLGNYNFIGLNSTIREQVEIKDDCFIGMGSNVLNNIESASLVYGNPAKTR